MSNGKQVSATLKEKWLKTFNSREDYPFRTLLNSSAIYCKICDSNFAGKEKMSCKLKEVLFLTGKNPFRNAKVTVPAAHQVRASP